VTLCQVNNAAATTHTGDQTETNLAACTIPAGAMGTQGVIRVTVLWSRSATTTNTVTYGVRHSTSSGAITGTLLSATDLTSGSVVAQTYAEIKNTAAATQQAFPGIGVPFSIASAGALVTGGINTANASYINLSCTDTTSSSDTCGVYSYTVELIQP
jgi:hypothetical protein